MKLVHESAAAFPSTLKEIVEVEEHDSRATAFHQALGYHPVIWFAGRNWPVWVEVHPPILAR